MFTNYAHWGLPKTPWMLLHSDLHSRTFRIKETISHKLASAGGKDLTESLPWYTDEEFLPWLILSETGNNMKMQRETKAYRKATWHRPQQRLRAEPTHSLQVLDGSCGYISPFGKEVGILKSGGSKWSVPWALTRGPQVFLPWISGSHLVNSTSL